MNFLRKIFEETGKFVEKGKPLSWAYPVWEAADTIFFSTNKQTSKGPHIRDNMDIKRTMFFVVIALIPCYLFGAYNIGYLNALALDIDRGLLANTFFGFGYVLPILIATFVAGAVCELTFAIIRKHEVNEGFLVSCALIPLTMPPDVPLWQVFIGTSFGIIIGKEIFGGVGTNVFNPALTARAFAFFAYPTFMSGDKVWVSEASNVDGISGETILGTLAANGEVAYSSASMFMGSIPGSVAETSVFFVLIGALLLIITGVGSWRIMLSGVIGASVVGILFNLWGANSLMSFEWYNHLLVGGFAFGIVFMATDPVSAAQTTKGKWIYGFLVGVFCILIRVFNPAYPEGVMLAILLMNVFAPLIDHYVIETNVSMRRKRWRDVKLETT